MLARAAMRPALPRRAGSDIHRARGTGRSGYEHGPMRDLPDWRFADGKPAPVSPRVMADVRRRERTAERIKSIQDSFPKEPGMQLLKIQKGAQGLVELEEEKQKVAAQREQKQAKKERYNQRKEAKKAGAAKPAAAASPSTK